MHCHKIIRLSIKNKGHIKGYCELSRKAKRCTHDAAVMAFAGPAAEAHYWGRWRPENMAGDITDLKDLVGQEHFADYRAMARIQVKIYWPVIQALAGELLQAGALSGKAAERIISEAWQRQRGEA